MAFAAISYLNHPAPAHRRFDGARIAHEQHNKNKRGVGVGGLLERYYHG